MNFVSLTTSLRVFGWLLWCDIRLLFKDFWNNTFDAICWPIVIILVNSFVLPKMGLPEEYGNFMVIGIVVLIASFQAWTASMPLAADIEHTRSIEYELSLPITYWLVYIKLAAYYAFKAAFFSLSAIVAGKFLLWNSFTFTHVDWPKFIIVYLLSNIMFATFALWATVLAGSVQRHLRLEIRITGPLFFICGYNFSWATLNAISPITSKLMLLTPWLYAYEGTRAAFFGQGEFINFWTSCGMLLFFTVLFGIWGLWLFKKRLDCV